MTIKCGRCGLVFKNSSQAIQHLKRNHPELNHIYKKLDNGKFAEVITQ